MLAAASDAIVIGFHLRPDPATRRLAEAQHVELKIYDIIYEAVDDVRAAMKGLLAPVDKEVAMGTVEVRELFRVPKIGVIAGCYVIDGEVKRNAKVRVIRDQVPVYDGTVSSLRRFKEDAAAVKQGFECGIGIEGFGDIKVGDTGTVTTMCRPVGTVRFGDELSDATSDGSAIEIGAKVSVIRRTGYQLIVEEV